MAGILDGIVKGIVNLAPQDNIDVMIFNAQSEIKEINEQENELYATLGKKVYESEGKDAYPEISLQLDQIKQKREELENKINQLKEDKEAKEREESISEGTICQSCGATNGSDSKFCCECGEKMPELNENRKRFCTACGTEVAEGMRFCSGCGASQE